MPFTKQDRIDAATPNSSQVTSRKIDLSQARSPVNGTCLVLTIAGKFLRNSADESVGGAQVSLDAAGTRTNLTDNNFYLSAGDAVKNVPFEKITIANVAQPGKFLYLSISDTVELEVQAITGAADVEGDVNVRNKSTAGGVTLSDIPGGFNFVWLNKDFAMSSDESYESGNREWIKNYKAWSIFGGNNGNQNFKIDTGFNQLSTVWASTTNFLQNYLTSAESGTLIGGNVGYDAFYKLTFYFSYFDQQGQVTEIIDSALLFGGAAYGEIRPSRENINTIKFGTDFTAVTRVTYPVVLIPANQANNMVLEVITAPGKVVNIDNDFDIACQWQRMQRFIPA